MNTHKKVAVGVVLIAVIVISNVITYKVDQHFDYVRRLEANVQELGGDISKLTEANLGLQSSLVEPPVK